MKTATIYFSDRSSITVSNEDSIIPIYGVTQDDDSFASMGERVELHNHIHDGLIPSILDALCFCDFFFVNENGSTGFCTKSIIKIENC